MRTKSLGGRRKRSPSATHSPIIIPFLFTIQDGCCAPLYETSSESDGDDHLKDVPMVDCTDQSSNRSPLDVLNYESVDLLDSNICICCNEGGVVLVCSKKGCPVTLHAKCMDSEPKFDESGNFYCPYCWYKRAVRESKELRKKAMIAKEALSSFLDNNVDMNMSDKLVQKDEDAKRKEPCVGDGISFGCENQPEGDQPRKLNNAGSDPCEIALEGQADADGDVRPLCTEEEMPVHIKLVQDSMNRGKLDKPNISESHGTGFSEEKESLETEDSGPNKEDECEKVELAVEEAEHLSASHLGKHTDGQSPDIAFAQGTEESVEKSAENKGRTTNKGKVSHREPKVSATGSSVSETIDSNSETISGIKRHGKLKVQRTAHPKKSSVHERNIEGENTGDIDEEVTSSKTVRKSPRSSKHTNKLTSLPVRRKRLRWTAEEEKALKDGVLRFAKGNESIPWRKILEFGSHAFDETRTPVDLKDKWRNIASKEGCK